MRSFGAKILLFGEYSILTGSSAITVPFKKYQAHLRIREPEKMNNSQKLSHTILKNFYFHLMRSEFPYRNSFNFDQMGMDIDSGLFLESSIPQHYGLGSSGALVASVFGNYCTIDLTNQNLLELKESLAEAESFFHGKSSGIDPLTSLLDEPVFFQNKTVTIIADELISAVLSYFFLFDTGIPSSTINYIPVFLENFNSEKTKLIYASYCQIIDETSVSVMNGDIKKISKNMIKISEFQYQYFQAFIPEKYRTIWYKGLETGEFYFKLCGSGGGGFLLLFSDKPLNELNSLIESKVIPIIVR